MYLSSSDCYPQHTTDLLFLHSRLMFRMVNAFPSGPFSMSSLPQIAFCSLSYVVTIRQCVQHLSQLDSTNFHYIHLIIAIKNLKRRMCSAAEFELLSQAQSVSVCLLGACTATEALPSILLHFHGLMDDPTRGESLHSSLLSLVGFPQSSWVTFPEARQKQR